MKYICLHIVLFCLLISAFSLSAHAQAKNAKRDPFEYRQTYRYNPYYNQMTSHAQIAYQKELLGQDHSFDFMKFRKYYAEASQYDPTGERILGELDKLAFIAVTEKDPDRIKVALFGYQSLVNDHLAHISVVMHALSLSRKNKRFGDQAFLEWLRDGLIWAITNDGHGVSLARAFNIFTMPEEDILFQHMGLEKIDTKSVQEGSVYYDMHAVIVKETQAAMTIFVKNTYPKKYLEAQKENEEENLTIDLGVRQ